MKRFTLTIKNKIILLAAVGILGLIASTAVNTIVDMKKSKDIALAENSQTITQIILKEVLLINTTSAVSPLTNEFSELHTKAKDVLTRLQSLAGDKKTRETSMTVENNERQLAEIFQKVTANNQTIDNHKKNIFRESAKVGGFVRDLIGAIN